MNDKRYTLILNRNFQPLGVASVKKTLGYFVGDEGKALDIQTFNTYSFTEWVELHNIKDPGATIRSERFWILIPEILVLNSACAQKKKKKHRTISKRKVFERDGHKCGYCETPLNSSNRTIDHIIPVSRGGDKVSYLNVVACCGKCNSKKGDKLLSEIGWTLKVKPYSPDSNLTYAVPKSRILPSWKPFLKTSRS